MKKIISEELSSANIFSDRWGNFSEKIYKYLTKYYQFIPVDVTEADGTKHGCSGCNDWVSWHNNKGTCRQSDCIYHPINFGDYKRTRAIIKSVLYNDEFLYIANQQFEADKQTSLKPRTFKQCYLDLVQSMIDQQLQDKNDN